jgi:hypothetical protein
MRIALLEWAGEFTTTRREDKQTDRQIRRAGCVGFAKAMMKISEGLPGQGDIWAMGAKGAFAANCD